LCRACFQKSAYRTARGSRQRVVAYLGELKSNEQSGWAQLGRRLDKKSRPRQSLFNPPHYDDPKDDEPVEVNLKGVRLERLRDFGDVWLALGLWRLLGLDKLLSDRMSEGREEICRHQHPASTVDDGRTRPCHKIRQLLQESPLRSTASVLSHPTSSN